MLGALQDNGGFTETLALDPASPAIDSGNDSTCAADDQRGVARPQWAGCDMGAYEYDGASPPIKPASPGGGAIETGGKIAHAAINPAGLTRLDFGRITIFIPAGALFEDPAGCTVSVETLGGSGEYGFRLDDTVWDVSVDCQGEQVSLFRLPITVCIRPADGVLRDKNVYHRHANADFAPLAASDELSTHACGETRVLSLFTLGQLALPATGFVPGAVSELAEQPAELAYAASDLTLSIPELGIELDILGVPQAPNGWDVSWLSPNQAGYLYGTAFPTWQGNSALTAHVWNADNTPGPFYGLSRLQHGDRFTVTAYGYAYIYEVRSNRLVSERNLDVLAESKYSQITLITCESYSEGQGAYLYRRAVQAVLVAVEASH